jgi:hypothetical protein
MHGMTAPGSDELHLSFRGPFAWFADRGVPSLFDAISPEMAGIYLWTIDRGDGHLVFYVGETGRCMRWRMAEHYAEHVAGRYSLHEPTLFAAGRKSCIWPGHYGKSGRTLGECVAASIELAPEILELSKILRFFVAPTTCERRLRRRAEAAIADALYAAPGDIGAFQDRGIRYERRRTDESPVRVSLAVERDITVLGFPASVDA